MNRRQAAALAALLIIVGPVAAPIRVIAAAPVTVDDGPGVAQEDAASTSIQANLPPVAVDDPAEPTCVDPSPLLDFGGAFPIPEDYGTLAMPATCFATVNDRDPDGTITAWMVDQGPVHGTLDWTGNRPGAFSYTPDPDFNTVAGNFPGGQWISDSFTYHVIDDLGGSSNEATYRFWVAPINDAPRFVSPPTSVTVARSSGPYDASWQAFASPGPADEAAQHVDFVVTDVATACLSCLFSTRPTFTAAGHLVFTPQSGAMGTATVTVHLHDDGGLDDLGVPNLAIPPADTSGPITFTIAVVDAAPVAGPDGPVRVDRNSGANPIDALANDTDADGDTLTIVDKTDGSKGTVAITGGGSGLTYTPATGQVGPDSFTYTIGDGHGGSDTATVSITIDQPPVAVGDGPIVVGEDSGATTIDVLANDSDPDLADVLTVTGVTDGSKGTVAIADGGTDVTYTPAPNANGSDSFTYTIDDGHGLTATATVDMTITAINDPPVAGVDNLTVSEDQTTASAVANPLANDTDVEGDPLTITGKTNGAKGIVTLDGGVLSYRPNANAFGSDAFTYTVSDGHGGTAIGTVNVTITAVNDPPNAVNDGVPTPIPVDPGAGATSIPVLANDTWLPDAPETLTITAVTQGSHGTVAITGGGTGLTYRPNGTTLGIDVFTYTISDGHGGTDQASVQVTVARDLTAPTATIRVLTKGANAGPSRLIDAVAWTLTETGSGIASELLQRRVDGGAWVTVSLSSVATRTAAFTTARGHLYEFRVRATDRAGNVGSFALASLHT